ncbi:pericentriolar material 1 protein isoform X1 [Chiloscyllium plagiosum]|uniref:pericentriolar material 1 protein isoform X1 n=1 Tax=Chiloscyllium plagiosum TaxID=36176 RepID=UPI001CB7DBD9|nr:pericentriolar material 1 protein isoform X1 [Chiloscyllium plagiosum]XP_043545861.1 pericentriolar material 1 protein isoform X1 [Chiloscyllium plagiosum]XP_043545870.1 pericentriolar material 1 protein isoform X1 [Chiloscyllium plagiosum]
MATGGDPLFEESIEDHNCTVNNGSLDDQLNNRDWSLQYKKANRSSEKNKKKLSAGSESRLTNDISPESSPGVGRRRAKTPKSYPPTKHASHFSVADSAELERLKQRINFSDLDERSIGSDSHGRATAANNQRPPVENRKPFNFLQQQINSNKSKELDINPQRSETKLSTSRMDLFASISKDSLPSDQISLGDDQGESEIKSSQVVSRLIQIRDYISKAHSMRDDLMEKNERSANVERLSQLIDHLKEQEKSYMKFLQKMLARENEEDEVGTTDSAVGSGSVADSTSLNLDVQSEASDATEASRSLSVRPCIEDKLGNAASQAQGSSVTSTPKGETDRLGLKDRRVWHSGINGKEHGISSKEDDQHRNAKEELENLKKQHELLKRMLEQQEQLKTLQGRQAALLALQHKAEQTIVGMEESVVTETTGSVSGLSLTSELNEELNDLIQRFHNQLQNSQSVPDNRRQAESLSLTQEVSRSRGSSTSDHLSEQKVQLVNKLKVLQGKKERMDKLLDELHILRDQHVNNSSISSSVPAVPCSSHKSDQRSCLSAPAEAGAAINREPSSLASSACILESQHENDAQDNSNPRKKLKKLKEVHKRLNELRELIDYYQQTSDMMTDAVNEHTNEDDNETEEESLYYSDQGNPETVTNIRNPQRSNWTDISGSSRIVAQNRTSCRNGRLLNTECEINNRPTNLQTSKMPLPSDEPHASYTECARYDDEKGEDRNGVTVQEQEIQGECASEGTISSRRSSFIEETDQDFEIQQKINRLNAAKQKLRQLQELVAMVQEVPDATDIDISNLPDFSLIEEDQHRQQPNNTRTNASRSSKEVSLDEEKREKFYEAKLQQQQQELKQLQEERKRLMEIQEKIRHLQKSCPDLQLSTSCAGNLSKIKVPIVTSTPAISGQTATAKALPDPVAAPPPDSELWSEMRRHQILREELRQRRKQLEALMAEHQRQKTLTENNSIVAASVKSEGTETQDTQQLSRTERTMATWGGSTQGALDDDEEEEEDDEEEENNNDAGDEEENDERSDAIANSEVETSSHETYTVYPNQERSQGTRNSRESKKRWKDKRTCSSDGNYRSFHKNKQHNVGMRRQENLRWAADLSYVEEREHWQEQVNQLTRQLEFSTNMCQTLMQDQQALSCLLQTFLTGPYSVMPSNVGSPQVHIIMHQLNQCYTQLAWQQNHVQRLKQMLNDLLHQQHQEKKPENQRDSGVPPPSPNSFVFPPCSFPSPPFNPLSMSRFPNCPPFVHGFNLNPVFPPGFSDLSQNVSVQSNEQQPVVSEHSISGKTEYLAFPKPFESNSPKYRENKWIHKQAKGEAEQSELIWLHDTRGEFGESPRQMQPHTSLTQMKTNKPKQQVQNKKRKNFEESSLESFSSMPDPVDPTTVTKTFKSRKACAQASLASKDKTPKGKCKKTYFHQKNQQEIAAGFESASNASASESCQGKVCHSTQTDEFLKPRTCSTTKDELEEKSKRKNSSDLSSEYAKGALLESNRNACSEAPETGSDFSLFEALRDNIYSEVATLISQNESRPHFLIELFHELQLLNTDYLRQRALYALQDIVTRHLSDKSYKEGKHTLSQNSAVWMTCNSELTPSESLATSDDEDVCGKATDHQAKIDLQQHEDAEYIESLKNASMLSSTSNLEPFANDDLGNTVIHLDKALSRMREYEHMKFENNQIDLCTSAIECVEDGYNAGNSCTTDSVPDASNVTCPRVDTQQLDKQIKAIMAEVIPFLKEHMDDVCSPQLLTTIGRMVLALTQQNDESKEFVKFFHDQLGAILQDSLAKFAGRKLKECGEDLLVEISEILFNELAFFRLMQDLDNSSVAAKQRCKRLKEVASFKQRYTTEEKQHFKENGSSAEELEDEDKDKDESETANADGLKVNESTEAELLLKSALSDREEDDVDSEVLPAKCVSISLSKAETQALTNYGSGEDENEEDEIEDFDAGTIDVQTSLQASNEIADENDPEQDARPEPNKDDVISQSMKTNLPMVAENESNSNPDLPTESFQTNLFDVANEGKKSPKSSLPFCENANAGTAIQMERENDLQGTPESSLAGSPDTDSPVLVNDFQEAGSGNLSQKSDEDDFVKVENLPPSLSALSEDELVRRISEEEQHNDLACVLLNADGAQELAGNPDTLKEPENGGARSA